MTARDSHRDVIHRRLETPVDFPVSYADETCWIYTSDGFLVLGAVAPSWPDARNLSNDANVAQLLSDFAHLASQYIARSRILRVQAGIALTHGVAPDFRRADLHRITVAESKVPAARLTLQETHPKRTVRATRRTRELAAWVHAANPLDPFVHRALYQYWRSCALTQAGFSEEAISALDGVVAVAAEAAHRWLKLPAQPSRREVGCLLRMSREDQGKLEFLYGLRCAFGAHPAHSKWWDFDDLYDDELAQFPDLVRRLLQKFLTLEERHRTVDPAPSSWGPWFLQNSELLLDAVWFTKLPAESLT